LQTLLLALTAHGLGTCVQVSIAGYPEIVHHKMHIPSEYVILCVLAVGYPDPDFPANKLRMPRNPIEKSVVFLDTKATDKRSASVDGVGCAILELAAASAKPHGHAFDSRLLCWLKVTRGLTNVRS
jgi:Nitroreductase family